MRTKFIEVTNGPRNWGKFMVAEFTVEEWAQRSAVAPQQSLIQGRGWDPATHKLVLDLQTGEAAIFRLGGLAEADLAKHRIWVCPMFEPFLTWLYAHLPDCEGIQALPAHVDLPEAPFALSGYRRGGPT